MGGGVLLQGAEVEMAVGVEAVGVEAVGVEAVGVEAVGVGAAPAPVLLAVAAAVDVDVDQTSNYLGLQDSLEMVLDLAHVVSVVA
eukprot:COSAG01_NODE_2814_length_7026_cov_16.232857_8_plen_85_part_00